MKSFHSLIPFLSPILNYLRRTQLSTNCSCGTRLNSIPLFPSSYPFFYEGRAVAQAVTRWLPTAATRVRVRASMWGSWWTKRHWGRFSPRTSVSPASHHSTNFSITIIARGWNNRRIGGRSAEWTQLDSTPHFAGWRLET
jgi:hypothetical protein